MAYINQALKKSLAPKIKLVCNKYGIKASLAVRNHSTLCLNIQSGKIDFIGNYNQTCCREEVKPTTADYIQVNVYHYKKHYTGLALAFLDEVVTQMNQSNHDNSDLMTDYFDVGWYTSVNIGQWDKPYQLTH